MKKIIYLIPAFVFMVACGETAENINYQTEDQNLEMADTLASHTLVDEVDDGLVYESVEDYTAIRSKDELYDLFDESNLKDDESWYAEGTVKFEITWLTNPANGHKVKFVWDQENGNDLTSIEFHYTLYNDEFEETGTQEILSNTGIFTGMSFEELKSWNDGPFEFSGFGWDYAGGIMPEQGSRIEQNPYGMRLDIDYAEDTYEKYDALIGDVVWSSDAPETDGAPIHLGTITYWVPE